MERIDSLRFMLGVRLHCSAVDHPDMFIPSASVGHVQSRALLFCFYSHICQMCFSFSFDVPMCSAHLVFTFLSACLSARLSACVSPCLNSRLELFFYRVGSTLQGLHAVNH